MHIAPENPAHVERFFALQMMFLGLSVLLGLMLLIRFGSPSQRMSADGTYSPNPMYSVQRYPRPMSEFLPRRVSTPEQALQRSSTQASSRERVMPKRSFLTNLRTYQTASPDVRNNNEGARAPRRAVRTKASTRVKTAGEAGRRTSPSSERAPYAPGWFWR